jgi:DNA-3-methyladenine glycosylase I
MAAMDELADGLVRAEDGKVRCWWHGGLADYMAYHDEEWGRPQGDARRLFEKLSLEGFQSGLSWLTILRKRANFRRAFVGFDYARIARFGPAEVEQLLADPGIVRHRGKIEAAIANARGTLELREQGTPLEELVWRHRPRRRAAPRALSELPASTPESVALSKELKRGGFRFVGPTTVYAAMQACGLVNDHIARCHVRSAVQQEIDAL